MVNYKKGNLVTSEYIDPNSFAYLAINSSEHEVIKIQLDGLEFQSERAEKRDYELALAEFKRGEYTNAMYEFTTFLNKYPNSGFKQSALFWSASINFLRNEYSYSVIQLNFFLAMNTNHARYPVALLILANAQLELNQVTDARKNLSNLIKNYPNSEEAKEAVKRISKLDPNSLTHIANNITNSKSSVNQSNLPACNGGNDTNRWNNCIGVKNFPNGDKYAGEFKDGKLSGNGTYSYADGDKYTGEFKVDRLNGQGSYNFAYGGKYIGEFKDGQFSGLGSYIFDDGRKYTGEWKEYKLNGKAIKFDTDGTIAESGIYQDDLLVTSQNIHLDSLREDDQLKAQIEEERRLRKEEEFKRKEEEARRKEAEDKIRQLQQANQVKPNSITNFGTDKRIALVIGNDSYSRFPVLSNAVNDSKAMSEALKQANFEVSYYKDLNKHQMEEVLNNFSKKLGKDDVGMFYFAGYGIQANSRNFLIPVHEFIKKPSDLPYEALDVDLVMESFRDSRSTLNIVVLDACRNSLDTHDGMSRGLTLTDAPMGSIVAYASAPCKTASDGDSGNSPFTKNLINIMQRKGLKIEDVFKELRLAVSRETNGEQVPQELSKLVGDFYFRQ